MNKRSSTKIPEPDYVAIGKRIKAARTRLGITQEKLAEMVSLSTPHMSHIENGKTRVSLAALILIANALQTSMDALLHDNIQITRDAYDKDFKDLLEDCSLKEKQFIYTAATELKKVLKDGTYKDSFR